MMLKTDSVINDNGNALCSKQEPNVADRLAQLQLKSQELLNKTLEHQLTWMDTNQVLSVLKVSRATLQAWRNKGALAYSQVGRKIYYKWEDLNVFLNIHYYKPYKI